MKPFIILQSTRNEAGSEILLEMPEYAGHVRSVIAEQAARLTQADLDGAKYRAVRTLAGVTKATTVTDLTIADLRFLASEVCDLDFYVAAPEWAKEAIDSVCERRHFTEKYVKHVLSAIRCIKAINARCEREQSAHEASMANRRKF